jgi:formylmethanofuran dehydrogenase subunit C
VLAPERPGRDEGGSQELPIIVVPDIRDYTKINSELTKLLDAGHRLVRLIGVDGQRLLTHGLRGLWSAIVIVEGNAGPELAAELDAPNLIVACSGSAKDGAGRGIKTGRLWIGGNAESAVGYGQSGGTIFVRGSAGPRAGLGQTGGSLMVVGEVGRLSGERQSGGVLMIKNGPIGPFSGHGRIGGRIILPGQWLVADQREFEAEIEGFGDPDLLR